MSAEHIGKGWRERLLPSADGLSDTVRLEHIRAALRAGASPAMAIFRKGAPPDEAERAAVTLRRKRRSWSTDAFCRSTSKRPR